MFALTLLTIVSIKLASAAYGGPGPVFCGGIGAIQCPRSSWECVPDPANANICVNECPGQADCGGVCAKNKQLVCGGIQGIQCPTTNGGDIECIDNDPNSCNAACGGSDCGGGCYDIMEPLICGGIQGLVCPGSGKVCVDDPTDNCDPDCGDADCIGVCVKLDGNTCAGILGTQCTGTNQECFDDNSSPGCQLGGACGADCDGVCGKVQYR